MGKMAIVGAMAMDLRWVGIEEADRVAQTRWMCYGHAGKDLARLKEHLNTGAWSGIGQYLLAEQGGSAIGTATSLPLVMWVRGSPVSCQGVAWVGTAKTSRRRAGPAKGVASQIMREILRYAREHEHVVSALMPFRVSFYEHFGYGVVERRAEWTIPLSAIPHSDSTGWKFIEDLDRPAAAESWQRSVQAGQCDIEWDAQRWTARLRVEEDGMLFVLHPQSSDQIRACALINHEPLGGRNALRIAAWSADSPEDFRALLGFLGTMRDQFSFALITTPIDWQINRLLREPQIPHRPVDHPTAEVRPYTRLQVRILDHRKFLESLHVPETAKGRVGVEIAECEGGVSRLAIEFDGGRAKVSPATGEPDLGCGDKIWAAIATGDITATQAVRLGLAKSANPGAVGLLDILAAGPVPFCREYF
jgi:predicted acetyltransferase